MSTITYDNKNESNIMCFKNENREIITSHIVNEVNKININKKVLYFNFLDNEEDLKNKYKILKNNNIIIIDKNLNNIDEIEKYILFSKPAYICIDYLKMVDKNNFYFIGNCILKYVLDKIEEFNKKYDVIFIIGINLEEN